MGLRSITSPLGAREKASGTQGMHGAFADFIDFVLFSQKSVRPGGGGEIGTARGY